MKRKFLEDLGLEKEVIDKIIDENSADIGKAKGELETVQKDLTDAKAEVDTLKGQITDRDKQLETLKNSTGDVEAMKKQIVDLQADNKAKDTAHAAEMKQLKVNNAIDAALVAAKAKNVIAVKALLKDVDKSELAEDGSVKGLKEQIDALIKAEDSKFLFDTQPNKTKIKGAEPGESGKENADDKVDLSKMTYDELSTYLEANPDTKLEN